MIPVEQWQKQWEKRLEDLMQSGDFIGMDNFTDAKLAFYRAIQVDALEYASEIAGRTKIEFKKQVDTVSGGSSYWILTGKVSGAEEVQGAIFAAKINLETLGHT